MQDRVTHQGTYLERKVNHCRQCLAICGRGRVGPSTLQVFTKHRVFRFLSVQWRRSVSDELHELHRLPNARGEERSDGRVQMIPLSVSSLSLLGFVPASFQTYGFRRRHLVGEWENCNNDPRPSIARRSHRVNNQAALTDAERGGNLLRESRFEAFP